MLKLSKFALTPAPQAHLTLIITIGKHRGYKTLCYRHSVCLRMYHRLVELQVRINHTTIAAHTLYHFAVVDTLGQLRFVVRRLPYCQMVQMIRFSLVAYSALLQRKLYKFLQITSYQDDGLHRTQSYHRCISLLLHHLRDALRLLHIFVFFSYARRVYLTYGYTVQLMVLIACILLVSNCSNNV